MRFVAPWIFWLSLPATLAAVTAIILIEIRKKRQLEKLFDRRSDWQSVSRLSTVKKWIKYILLIAALPLLGAAAARPYIKSRTITARSDSRDIAVLFDVSRSMRAADLPPDRMAQAKYLLREITDAFPGDRFALIPFAGSALVACPSTLDHHTFSLAVNELSPESVPLGGTDIEAALTAARKSFPATASTSRVVIMLTDGDELSGNTAKIAEELKKERIPLVIVGFGSPETAALVPGDDGKIIRQEDGSPAVSKLNEALLQKLASDTGGLYIRSTVSDTGFAAVKKFLEQNISSQPGDSTIQEEPDDLFPYFIGAGVILLALSAAISARKGSFLRSAAVVMVLLCCGADQKTAADQALFREAYQKQLSGDPASEALYLQLISDQNCLPQFRAGAMQNLAVIHQHSGRKHFAAAEAAVKAEDLNGAEKSAQDALKKFKQGKELHVSSFKLCSDTGFDRSRVKNFNALLNDMKKTEELLKKIAELKKLQQQTAQQTRDAREQSQQDKQNQQNQQNQQGQQDKSSGGKESRQDRSSKPDAGQTAEKSRQAADTAGKLADRAQEMEQNKLAENAKSVQKDLQEAEKLAQDGKLDEAQEKLDSAQKKLRQLPAAAPEKSAEKNSSAAEQQTASAPAPQQNKDEAEDGAMRVIDLLNEESGEFRNMLQRRQHRQHRYHRQVKKDW